MGAGRTAASEGGGGAALSGFLQGPGAGSRLHPTTLAIGRPRDSTRPALTTPPAELLPFYAGINILDEDTQSAPPGRAPRRPALVSIAELAPNPTARCRSRFGQMACRERFIDACLAALFAPSGRFATIPPLMYTGGGVIGS